MEIWGKNPGQGHSRGQGPGVGLCRVHLRNSEEVEVEGDRPGKVSQARGRVKLEPWEHSTEGTVPAWDLTGSFRPPWG